MRRKKNRAKRKDGPMPTLDAMSWFQPTTAPLTLENSGDFPEPERVHVTKNGRGCVSRLRGGRL